MKKRILFLSFVVLAVAVALPRPAAAQLTNSTVSSCINDDTDTTCANKMHLEFPVSYGNGANLDVTYVDTVTTVGGDEAQTLEETLQFQVSKTIPQYIYALRSADLVGSLHPTYPFQAYQIDSPRPTFAVNIATYKETVLMSSFQIAPDSPLFLDKTSSHQVKAQLLNTMSPSHVPPDLSSDILFIWTQPPTGTQKGNTYNLLVPMAMVPASTSLNVAGGIFSLLQRLTAQDEALLASNPTAQPKYVVNNWSPTGQQNTNWITLSGLSLMLQDTANDYSTIALEMDPADVAMLTNEAQGYITGAYVLKFTSMSKSGTLVVDVQNSGNSQSNYLVTVTGCTTGINPIPAQSVTLGVGATAELDFDVSTNANLDASHNCLVSLLSATGRVFDSVTVYFNTTVDPSL